MFALSFFFEMDKVYKIDSAFYPTSVRNFEPYSTTTLPTLPILQNHQYIHNIYDFMRVYNSFDYLPRLWQISIVFPRKIYGYRIPSPSYINHGLHMSLLFSVIIKNKNNISTHPSIALHRKICCCCRTSFAN
jgi:hypothetical protein